MGTISKNFSYHEFEASALAKENRINNTITSFRVRDSIKNLVCRLIQPIRDYVGCRVNVGSGYRCEELNNLLDASPTSQHKLGEAADIWCPTKTPYELACIVVEHGLPFDQMILYPSFLHLSLKFEGEQRFEILYNKSYKGSKVKRKS